MLEKLCPLRNMSPCAGHQCVFFMDCLSNEVTDNETGKKMTVVAGKLPVIPCAFILSAFSSFYQYSMDIGEKKLSEAD